MKRVVHKAFWAWDFDEEEKWLNEMAEKGFALSSAGRFRYEFEESLPGEYNIRLELLEHCPSHIESQDYIRFLEETGVEHVSSVMRWGYFRKKTVDGTFDLYSDNESRIQHLNRILILLATFGTMNLCTGIYNLFLCFALQNLANSFGIINLLLGLMILYGYWKTDRKRRGLKKKNQIFE